MMVRSLAFTGVLAAIGLMSACQGISEREVDKNQVSVAEVRRLMDTQTRKHRDDIIVLVDPRPPSEFAKGHIPGALNIQLTAIKDKEKLDPILDRCKNIVVYGKDPSSATARAMTHKLMGAGYSGVVFFKEGLYQWLATGGELASEDVRAETGQEGK